MFVDLPEVGAKFAKGDAFGSVESVKAASSVYTPVTGTVSEVNDKLKEDFALVNKAADGEGWMIKVKFDSEKELDGLLDEAAYKQHCENAAH